MSEVVVDIYGRVSTQEQVDGGYSLGEQEDRLRKYCEANGWIVHDVLMDGGFSGASIERPGIQKVIKDAKAKNINKVIVYKLDRLSRSQKDTLYLIEEVFLPNKVDFASMTETLDTSSPLGMAMIGILSVFAQLEREQIKERMQLGKDARAKIGKYNGNRNRVIGYNYDTATSTLTQDDYQASIVVKVFKWYAEGQSEAEIARRLSAIHFCGHQWMASKVKRMINQPLYIGEQRWKGETYRVENCPCIITDELWNEVQKVQAQKDNSKHRPQTSGIHKSMLGGILWCGCCEARYAGVSSTEHDGSQFYRYYCYSRVFKAHGLEHRECDNIGWRSDKLNGIILDEIRKLQTDGNLRDYKEDDSTREEFSSLENRIKILDNQKERLIDLYALGTIDAESIEKRSAAIQKEKEAIQAKIEDMKKPSGLLSHGEFESIMRDFNDLDIDTASTNGNADLYNIVHKLIQSITLTYDEVKITWNFDI